MDFVGLFVPALNYILGVSWFQQLFSFLWKQDAIFAILKRDNNISICNYHRISF